MRTVSESHTPPQQKLFDRVGSKLKAPSAFAVTVVTPGCASGTV